MIQRIQTVFLLVTVILLTFIIFFPFAELLRHTDEVIFNLSIRGLLSDKDVLAQQFPVYPVTILLGLCYLLSVVTIFLYKRRMLQIRLSVFNIILLIGLQGIMFYYIKFAKSFLDATASYKLFFVFPLVSAILVFLALRAIARDEALVRSLDRLR